MTDNSQDQQSRGVSLVLARAAWAGLALLVMALYLWGFIISGVALEDIPYGILMPVGYFAIAVVILLAVLRSHDGLADFPDAHLTGTYPLTGLNQAIGEQNGWQSVNALLVAIGAGTVALFIFVFPMAASCPAGRYGSPLRPLARSLLATLGATGWRVNRFR